MPVSFAGYRNIRFSNQGFATGIIQMEVAFYNPNSFPMKIKGTDLQVFVNKQPFGQVTQDSASQMPAKDTFLMPVSMKVNLIDLLQKVLHTSGQDSVMLEASGSCKIGRGGVFVNVPLHYRSKEILKMF
jgi:LEA14-like dessication related protein